MQKADSLGDCMTKASVLQTLIDTVEGSLQAVESAKPGLQTALEDIAALKSSGQAQFGAIVLSPEQEAASIAARIIDLFQPIWNDNFQRQVSHSLHTYIYSTQRQYIML